MALAAAVSPTLLAFAILLLSSKDHPRLRVLVYLAGSTAALTVIGFVAVAGSTAASTKPAQPSTVSAAIDILLGGLLFIGGVEHIVESPKSKRDGQAEDKTQAHSQTKAAQTSLATEVVKDGGMGVALTVTNFSSLVFYLAAAKSTADAKLPAFDQVLAMGIVALGILAPIILPLAATIVAPKTSQRFLGAVKGLVQKDGRYIAAGVALLFGLYLLYKGGRVLI